MDLSILIATVPPRKKYLNRLLTGLQNQIIENNLQDKIEVIVYEDDFETVIGYKKNKLYESAKGKYVVSIDDDDMVSDDYCKTLIDVIDNHDVDQISFTHAYYHNNKEKWIPIITSKENKYYHANFKLIDFYITKYHKEKGTDYELHIKDKPILKVGKNSFFKKLFLLLFFKLFSKKITKSTRYSSHTVALKKEIAQSVKFTDRLKEEDVEWATEIYRKGLIKTDYVIDRVLYHYFYDDNMSIDRGKQGSLTKEEKKIVLNKNLNTIKDIDWVIRPIDKINIKWI